MIINTNYFNTIIVSNVKAYDKLFIDDKIKKLCEIIEIGNILHMWSPPLNQNIDMIEKNWCCPLCSISSPNTSLLHGSSLDSTWPGGWGRAKPPPWWIINRPLMDASRIILRWLIIIDKAYCKFVGNMPIFIHFSSTILDGVDWEKCVTHFVYWVLFYSSSLLLLISKM